MRQHTDDLLNVLRESFTRRTFVDVFHGTDRVIQDLPVTDWSLDAGLTSEVKANGGVNITHQSLRGESLVPEGTMGVLSPFRARLAFTMEISAGSFSERINLGTFKVTSVPSARNYFAEAGGREFVFASQVELEFYSLDMMLKRWGFRYPEQPPQHGSAYEELRRITGMPVEETVPDQRIPAGATWEAKQGGRLAAVAELGRILGGTVVPNSVGALTIVPDELTAPVMTLELGERGTVIDVDTEIDTDGVYNEVVGIFEQEDDREPIYAVATAPAGPLDPQGLYEPYTRYYSSDMVKTQSQANTAVQSILDLSLGSQQYDIPIKCHVNPLVELGDVVSLDGWERPITGRVIDIGISDAAYMDVTLRVKRRLL